MKSVYIICDKNDEPIGLDGGKYEIVYGFTTRPLAEAHIEKGQKVNKFKLMREK
jgi:hypothetical protein